MRQYDFKQVEAKWREKWERENTYQPDMANPQKPFYNLMMFPYPSAEGMHMGNMRTFAGIDAYGRFKRLQGYEVFQPIGLDGFGIHAENYAIKVGEHPSEQAKVTEKRFYDQFKLIGNGFPWDYALETYDPAYYRWTQWLFIQMFKNGLAERKESTVNWCPSCKTVLADEQVINGRCERCDTETTQKKTEQWFFKITEYAERLLQNVETIDWPEKIKTAQRNWIGRSDGANVKFKMQNGEKEIEIFTTRIDTIYGVTFIVMAPDHPLLDTLEISKEAQTYRQEALKKTEQARKIAEREKTGAFTGLYAIHPLTQEKIPIWVADFVLMGYGTGAIMGVPAHDERDYEFAKKYHLSIRQVVHRPEEVVYSYLMGAEEINDGDLENLKIKIIETTEEGNRKICVPVSSLHGYEQLITEKLTPGFWNEYIGEETVFMFKDKNGGVQRIVLTPQTEAQIHALSEEFIEKGWTQHVSVWGWLAEEGFYKPHIMHGEHGVLVHSGPYDGLTSEEAKKQIVEDLGEKAFVETNYHLRDWLISRQRYWGPPIPMVFCDTCGWQPVPEDQLPIELPYIDDYKPTGDGKSPLEKAPEEWLYTSCPQCGSRAKRETDVSDTFLDSSWYFLAYPSLPTTEWKKGPTPFDKTMTNKWLPVDAYIGGAEHAVLHLLYARFVTMALHDWGFLNFSDTGEPFPYLVANGLLLRDGGKMSKSKGNVIVPDEYVEKFGADAVRLYLAFTGPFESDGDFRDAGMESMARFVERIWDMYVSGEKIADVSTPKVLAQLHRGFKKVAEDIERFKYNTAVSMYMEIMNAWKEEGETLSKDDAAAFLQILAPFAPFMTEDLWQQLGREGSIHHSAWPAFDPALLVSDTITIVVQVNGKVRGSLELEKMDELYTQQVVEGSAKGLETIQKHLEGKDIRKVIYVPDKLINFVI